MSDESKPLNPPPFTPIEIRLPNQFTLPTFNIEGGGQVHETFQVDRFGNLYDAHTTLQAPEQPSMRTPWKADD